MSVQAGNAHAGASAAEKFALLRDVDVPRPDRQRGMASFLTWSFFLASFFSMADAAAASTRAIADDLDASRHPHASDSQPTVLPHPPMSDTTFDARTGEPMQSWFDSHPHEGAPASVVDGAGHSGAVSAGGTEISPSLATGGGDAYFGNADFTFNVQNVTDNYHVADGGNVTINNGYHISGPDVLPALPSILSNTLISVDLSIHQVVDSALGTVASVVDGASHTASTLLTNVASTVNGLLPAVGSTIGHLTDGVTASVDTVVHDTTHVINHAVGSASSTLAQMAPGIVTQDIDTLAHEVAQPAASIVTAAVAPLNILGLSSGGSLSFTAVVSSDVGGHDVSLPSSAYTQYGIALHDLSISADASASVSTTDSGAITTIIGTAIGIGHPQSDAGSDSPAHSLDLHGTANAVFDLFNPQHHHAGLLG